MTENEVRAADALREAANEVLDAARGLPHVKGNEKSLDGLFKLLRRLNKLETDIRRGQV